MFGFKRKAKAEAREPQEPAGKFFDYAALPWLPSEQTGFPFEVLDLRQFTQTMMSTSTDPSQAMAFMSVGAEGGARYIGREPSDAAETPCDLRYPLGPVLGDGPLFLPPEMEHKWAIFHHAGTLYFVRSWTHDLAATATVQRDGDTLRLARIRGRLGISRVRNLEGEELAAANARAADFLIRSHIQGEIGIVPLPPSTPRNAEEICLECWTLAGRFATAATFGDTLLLPRGGRAIGWDEPVYSAVATGDAAAVQRALQTGASPDGRGCYKNAPALHCAAATGRTDLAALLLDAGARTESRDTEGATALSAAMVGDRENLDVVRLLLERGAAKDAADAKGVTPLMSAAAAGHAKIVEALIRAGANVNPRDHAGFTPLHSASERGHAEVVRLLLAAGADVSARAGEWTPMAAAKRREQAEIIRLLQGAGATE